MRPGPQIAAVPGRAHGFTLFEMLVVMAVIALSAAMVLPKLAGTNSKYNLKTSAKSLAASLRYAQNRAVSEIRPVAVTLDADNGRIVIQGLPPLQDPMQALLAATVNHTDNATQKYDLPSSVGLEVFSTNKRYERGVYQLIFYPGGNTSGGAMRLSNDSGREIFLVVEKFTGRVMIDPPSAKGM